MALEFTKTVNQFSHDIYKNCVAEKDENIILSPLSIQTAISMAFMGAKGQTAAEMSSVMKFGQTTKKQIGDNFQSFMETINSDPTVKIANKIYIQNEYPIKKEFNEIVTKQFYSEAQNLNFAKNVESAKEINTWVESNTNNKIKNLIDSGALDSSTRMVLVNAIYFKGDWVHKFDTKSTRPEPFWVTPNDSIDVPMMHIKKRFNYGVFEELDATGLEMKYVGSDISMFIILPNKKDGLKKLEADLGSVDIASLAERLHSTEVNVSLPKFKVEYEIKLKPLLKKMGMSTMFSEEADFSDLLESPEPLQVSEVIHKAFIEVNEEGAEAAAATGMVMMMCSAPMFREETFFKVEHPFIYHLIKHGTSVFSGRLINVK